MPDHLTPQQRHRCMSHIRSKATKPEILVLAGKSAPKIIREDKLNELV